ncbi:excinuclease ABC subunit B [Candidatus Nomurabacteria bacterium RIFCSPLOWO2_01_FULL_42_17]|uniref:UvrABC system protein B n=1 Tax=Candidatus Nomurabacteria bacterium RIFCSPLOWO2_01_FULL_42_17 TaxID=1801780 RepID=A0A1F6XMS6_9BACT|nr:MAG: excinuclease ABC subunit B [Candidatus Nomurabacteria bacterium RIFCSPLOWO2_01_FULL_42_17]
MKAIFKLHNPFQPAGDQPIAISKLVEGLTSGMKKQTLLGATGTGKTFTMANVIAQYNKPTLVIAHNKTLAAQLAQEFRLFFPDSAVHYFVSYYDYYQPEAYMPASDTYIEKDASINKEIDMLRHASTQALLTRPDVIIVASVSCIYGLGSPEEYEKVNLKLEVGERMDRMTLMKSLIAIHFERTNADLTPGSFRSLGSRVEFMPVSESIMYQIEFSDGKIAKIIKVDPISSKIIKEVKPAKGRAGIFIFPAKHFITEDVKKKRALVNIKKELEAQLKKFNKEGKLLEAERIKRRTNYDLAMIREVGYCNGIENYSRHLSGKSEGEPPETLLSYFPSARRSRSEGGPGFLTIIDESHVTLPQLQGMYAGDASRKNTLVEYGFRLPSAKDNRPLKYEEFEERIGQVVYTSATPSEQERSQSEQIVEQIIRPTGLVDPETIVRPVSASSASEQTFGTVWPGGGAPENRGPEQKTGHLPNENKYPGQIQDFIKETEKTIAKGFRVLATTLTKKMAEDLSVYLKDKKIKAEYLHSDIKTMERIKILTQFRKGDFDVLVGVNLLREGLDLPEVALIGILDADKAGFLRSETSLIQTIGRAARNSEGKVILYADIMTDAMEKALGETARRRNIQIAYNKKHGITPKTIMKKIEDITQEVESEHAKTVNAELALDVELFTAARRSLDVGGKKYDKNLSDEERNRVVYEKIIKIKEKEMNKAVKELDFETAAILRDEIGVLKIRLEKK